MSATANEYSFYDQLAIAEEQEANPIWQSVYKEYFPDFLYMSPSIPGPSPQQKLGRDRTILSTMGSCVTVDEKVSKYSSDAMFLEYWSNKEQNQPGWVCDPYKEADYVCYMWANDGVAVMLPFRELRQTWLINGTDWRSRYPCRPVISRNGGTVWTSEGCIVPTQVVLDGISQQSRVILTPEMAKKAKEILTSV